MAEQNDVQEWDESDESGDEGNTYQMENKQSDQQMATMAGSGQLNLSGPSQLGGGNTQNINPDNSNSNNVVYNNCTFVLNNDNYTQMTHSFQVERGQQPSRLSDNPPSGRLTEQCLQHMHNRIQAQSSWTGPRCPFCGSPTLPDQSPPTPSQPVATGSSQTPAPTPSSCPPGQSQIKQINDGIVRSRLTSSQPVSSRPCSTDSGQDIRPQAGQKRENNQLDPKKQQVRSKTKKRRDEQSKSQLPRCSVSTQTNAAPAIETKDIQSAPTETPDSVTDSTTLNRKLSSRRAIVDSFGDKLKPGDCVRVQLDRRSVHWGVYLGGFEMVHFDKNTQEVKIEMMDMIKDSQNFTRRTIISNMHMTNISHTCYRLQPSSSAQCKIFPAETRLDRARSCVGKVSPVRETWCGADFVSWIFTGLNWDQAGKKGFELCY